MTRTALAALLLSVASPAAAVDLGNGLSLTGEVELEHGRAEISESFLRGDVTLGWRNAGTEALGFGFDLNVVAINPTGGTDDVTMYWGGLVLSTGFGEITLGGARPVLDDVYDFPDFSKLSLYEIGVPPFAESYTTFFTALQDEFTPGVSLVGSSGALGYGLSLHEVESFTGSVRSTQLALTYATGDTTFLGGFETLSLSTGSLSNFRLGVVQRMEAITLGAEVGSLQGTGTPDVTTARLHGAYDVTDALTVGANLGYVEDVGGSDTLWSANAEYRFGNGGFIEGGVTSLGTSDDIVDIGIGFRF